MHMLLLIKRNIYRFEYLYQVGKWKLTKTFPAEKVVQSICDFQKYLINWVSFPPNFILCKVIALLSFDKIIGLSDYS